MHSIRLFRPDKMDETMTKKNSLKVSSKNEKFLELKTDFIFISI